MSIVTVERHPRGIVRVVLDHPDARNAMGVQLRGALEETFSELFADPAVRVLILASALPDFSVGGDLSRMDELTDPKAGRRRLVMAHHLVRMLLAAEKPIIAEVRGYAVGAGAGLVLACDTVIMSEGASLGFNFFRVGLVPDFAIAHTLTRRIGHARARQALLFGRTYKGPEAGDIGIADEVVSDDALQAQAMKRAEQLAAHPSLALGLTKRMLEQAGDASAVLEFEAMAQPMCFASDDFTEGLAAFREKRKPHFDPESK